MQIVIEIPDSIYSALCSETYPIQDAYKIALCVKNGTPLPEHHGRLIDAEVACPNHTECVMCPIAIECSICAAPTIIPATKEGE